MLNWPGIHALTKLEGGYYHCSNKKFVINCLLYSDHIELSDQDKVDFLTNFLQWKQENETMKRQNCLLLNFGLPNIRFDLPSIRRVIRINKETAKLYRVIHPKQPI